jgi:Na+-transporting NADH:ubiquinone oxidoreductase subunit NqrB
MGHRSGQDCPTPTTRELFGGQNPPYTFSIPTLKDPRFTIAAALTLWTVLGQTSYYFNRDPLQIVLAVGTACVIDVLIALVGFRQLLVPLSAYITGLSVGILLESFDWRVYVVASTWGILSKHLLRDATRHFFNPSNFAIVLSLVLCREIATVAPGSQWGADYRVSLVIIGLGLLMMRRVKRLDLTLSWLGGFVLMGLFRMALGQGGLVFALGPMTGAEFALFTFSMLPDPKVTPPTKRGRILWGLSIAAMDGVLRYFEIRYSMFFALFVHTGLLPIMRWIALRAGIEEADPWRVLQLRFFTYREAVPQGSSKGQGSSP